jgi:hypothetical protein
MRRRDGSCFPAETAASPSRRRITSWKRCGSSWARLGYLAASEGGEFPIEYSLLTASSVLFDAIYVPGGEESVRALAAERDAVRNRLVPTRGSERRGEASP